MASTEPANSVEGFDADGRPESADAARKAIDRIRSGRGHISDLDEVELSKTDLEWQENYRERAEEYRQVYARYTKT
jgi:hypothetical protein